jgi:hypothetical protein
MARKVRVTLRGEDDAEAEIFVSPTQEQLLIRLAEALNESGGTWSPTMGVERVAE